MPTYDYRCKTCEAKSQSFQKITDEPLTNCNYCGQNSLERCFGYMNDYKLEVQPTTHNGSFSCCPCCKFK